MDTNVSQVTLVLLIANPVWLSLLIGLSTFIVYKFAGYGS